MVLIIQKRFMYIGYWKTPLNINVIIGELQKAKQIMSSFDKSIHKIENNMKMLVQNRIFFNETVYCFEKETTETIIIPES